MLASWTPIERNLVLDGLLVAHPELSDEAEAPASGLLSSPSAEQVAFGLVVNDGVAATWWSEWDVLL